MRRRTWGMVDLGGADLALVWARHFAVRRYAVSRESLDRAARWLGEAKRAGMRGDVKRERFALQMVTWAHRVARRAMQPGQLIRLLALASGVIASRWRALLGLACASPAEHPADRAGEARAPVREAPPLALHLSPNAPPYVAEVRPLAA